MGMTTTMDRLAEPGRFAGGLGSLQRLPAVRRLMLTGPRWR